MSTVAVKPKHRFAGRARVVVRALARRAASIGVRRPPHDPQRILIAHHLLLGDTLMLTPLLAKLREQHPSAEIVMALPEPYAPLYAAAPYGVKAIGWNPSRPGESPLWRQGGFDLALIAGDNRFAWLALALGSRWIVAFDGDHAPVLKRWPIDEWRNYSATPAAWGDMVAALVDGPAPARYDRQDWPNPSAAYVNLPSRPYAVLHVGASTPLKLWDPIRWRALATRLSAQGVVPVWSADRGEMDIIRACDPGGLYRSFAGALTLTQLWTLIAHAALLVAPDTGVAHLGRIIGTPTVALFGPGSSTIAGGGEFWRHAAFRAVTVDPFPCRDQRVLFKREIAWARRCGRTIAECAHPKCMDAIELDRVIGAIEELRGAKRLDEHS
jgi:ADP-heptose:LPS heptosyltransferase